MKTQKQLREDMVSLNPTGQEAVAVTNETFGRVSMMYLWTKPEVQKWWAEKLEAHGHKIDRKWTRVNNGVAVEVRYFKGWHWDE